MPSELPLYRLTPVVMAVPAASEVMMNGMEDATGQLVGVVQLYHTEVFAGDNSGSDSPAGSPASVVAPSVVPLTEPKADDGRTTAFAKASLLGDGNGEGDGDGECVADAVGATERIPRKAETD